MQASPIITYTAEWCHVEKPCEPGRKIRGRSVAAAWNFFAYSDCQGRHCDGTILLNQGLLKSNQNRKKERLTIKSQVFEGRKTEEISQTTAAFDKQHSSAGNG